MTYLLCFKVLNTNEILYTIAIVKNVMLKIWCKAR